MKLFKNTIIASAIALVMSNASAATLDVSNGILMGAFGVTVNNQTYDVTFADGLLGNSITEFTTKDDATAASNALLALISSSNYGTLKNFTNGCTSTFSCSIVTGYMADATNVDYAIVGLNSFGPGSVGSGSGSKNFNTSDALTGGASLTIASWKLVASAVPEPEAYAMMLTGLGLVGFAARRKQQAA